MTTSEIAVIEIRGIKVKMIPTNRKSRSVNLKYKHLCEGERSFKEKRLERETGRE